MFERKVVDKIKTHIFMFMFSPRKSFRLLGKWKNTVRVRQAAGESIMRRREDAICMPDN
jgi:hypothetical protein